MSKEIIFDNLYNFIKEVKMNDIRKIAFSEVNEKRTKQMNPDELHVVHVKKADVLAYKSSIVYKCILEDIDLDEVYDLLLEEGFEVTRINKNIT